MQFIYDDGGRAAAKFQGRTGDCVVRAIAIATGLPYIEVYNELYARSKSSPRNGVPATVYKPFLAELGWRWRPTMHIGSGCVVHLTEAELPSGTLIVRLAHHLTAVLDGVIHDAYNPSVRRTTIYGPTYEEKIPKLAHRLANGDWAYSPERCVYGYWSRGAESIRQYPRLGGHQG